MSSLAYAMTFDMWAFTKSGEAPEGPLTTEVHRGPLKSVILCFVLRGMDCGVTRGSWA